MDGVVYYPYIRVPDTEWFNRVILYWDSVATIVPDRWIQSPYELGPYTLDLVQRGLLVQLLPSYTDLVRVADLFGLYYDRLKPSERARRQRVFSNGNTELVHSDKGTIEGFSRLRDRGICERAGDWWKVERRTAADYMAMLALGLAAPGHDVLPMPRDPSMVPRVDDVRRVPLTDQMHSLLPLLAGTAEATSAELRERAEGQARVGHIQMVVLKKLFPGPSATVEPEKLERFLRRHGDLLPNFRREVEKRVDEIFNQVEAWQQRRVYDRLESEFQDAIQQVEAYMSESRFGRILRSPWCALVGVIPGLGAPTQAAAAAAEIALPAKPMPRSPLAYAAFASLELTQHQRQPRVIRDEAASLILLASEAPGKA
jgi:hypothetical protein